MTVIGICHIILFGDGLGTTSLMESAENKNLHQREISSLRDVLYEFRLKEDHIVFGFYEGGDEEKISLMPLNLCVTV